MYENYATFSGSTYLRWTNPDARLETSHGLQVDWPSLRPVVADAVRHAHMSKSSSARVRARAAHAATGDAGADEGADVGGAAPGDAPRRSARRGARGGGAAALAKPSRRRPTFKSAPSLIATRPAARAVTKAHGAARPKAHGPRGLHGPGVGAGTVGATTT